MKSGRSQDTSEEEEDRITLIIPNYLSKEEGYKRKEIKAKINKDYLIKAKKLAIEFDISQTLKELVYRSL